MLVMGSHSTEFAPAESVDDYGFASSRRPAQRHDEQWWWCAIADSLCRGEVAIGGMIDVGGGGGQGERTAPPQGGGFQYAVGGGAGGTVVSRDEADGVL